MKSKLLSFLLAGFVLSKQSIAQSCQTTFIKPAAATSVPFAGSTFPFQNASGICSPHHQIAAAAPATMLSGKSEYLLAQNFQLNLPPDAGIMGIEVKLIRSASGISLGSEVKDYAVYLVKNGLPGGQNKAMQTPWSTDVTTVQYGGQNDQWDGTWQGADLNAANFGVAVSANMTGNLTLMPTAMIHSIEVKVFYNVTLSAQLLQFEAKPEKETIKWAWKVASLETQTQFALERSSNKQDWMQAHYFVYTGNDKSEKTFTLETRNEIQFPYYRLKIVHPNGKTMYSAVKQIVASKTSVLTCYPNPAKDYLVVKTNNPAKLVTLYGLSGKTYQVTVWENSLHSLKLDVQPLPQGYYVGMVGENKFQFLKE